jgi:2-dehydropantoate 2-reductase
MKITVIGTGGVGGYFGARLALAGNDVTFVARGRHLDAIRRDGLHIESPAKPAHVKPVTAVADARDIPAADAIFFAVKMADTETAAESLKGLTAAGAAVFTFQNGVESAERIGRVVGAGAVVPGVARISSHISAPGVITQVGTFASIEFGEPDGKPSARATALYDACKAADIEVRLSPNIQRALWMKFAMLAPFSGVTALTQGPIGPVRTTPDSRRLLEAAVKETVALGMALRTGLESGDADAVMKVIDALPAEMMASMAHDLRAGKPIEVNGLSGAVARLGAAAGVATPVSAFIAQALSPFVPGRPRG